MASTALHTDSRHGAGIQDATSPNIALMDCPRQSESTVVSIDPMPGLAQRLAMLGIRRGTVLTVLHGPDARGAVVGVGTARIALGRDIVASIRVRPVPAAAGANPGDSAS